MLSPSIIKRLMLSRFFFNNAMEHARAHNEFAPYLTANLLQDALEIFLLAAAEHVNAKIEKKTDFVTYLDRIDDKIAPNSLPFRARLITLNKIRVGAKHDGIRPDTKEIEGLAVMVHEFLRAAAQVVFSVDYMSINLISLIDDEKVRNFLTEADAAYRQGNFSETLIACRKAFYSMFEKRYDIRAFENDQNNAFGALLSDAPYYARSKDYIDKRVATPFDYIVLDVPKIDHDLLKDRIDPVVFWNIWRLTPSVYEHPVGNWLVKNDLEVLEAAVQQNAAYVLENLVEIILRRQDRKKTSRYARNGTRYGLVVRTKNAKVYRKADRNSELCGTLPDDARQVDVSASVPGLREKDGPFWEVRYAKKSVYLSGFVHEDDLDLTAPLTDVDPIASDLAMLGAILGSREETESTANSDASSIPK